MSLEKAEEDCLLINCLLITNKKYSRKYIQLILRIHGRKNWVSVKGAIKSALIGIQSDKLQT